MAEPVSVVDKQGNVSSQDIVRLVILLVLGGLMYMIGTAMYNFIEDVIQLFYIRQGGAIESFVILAIGILAVVVIVYLATKWDPSFKTFASFSPL